MTKGHRREYILLTMVPFPPSATFTDVLNSVSELSNVPLPFGLIAPSIHIFKKVPELNSDRGVLLHQGLHLIAIDCMQQFDMSHVLFDFPPDVQPSLASSSNERNAFEVMMHNA